MKRSRKYFHFQKPVRADSDNDETKRSKNQHSELVISKDEENIGSVDNHYPHAKRPPRAENRTQAGRNKTVYAQLIGIRENVADSAKVPRSNIQLGPLDPQAEPNWTRDVRLKVVSTSDALQEELHQPLQLPIYIPSHSTLGREWIDRYQYPRCWSDIFPHFTSGKVNVQPYEKDETRVATDAIRLSHLEDAIYKKRDARGSPYNCLDLSDQIGIHIFPPEIDRINLTRSGVDRCLDQARRQCTKSADLTFNILSMRDSFTPPHVDAGGYLTFVHMVKGKKVWYLLGKSLPEMDAAAKDLISQGGISLLTEKTDVQWSRVLLAKGDSLILPAGLTHCVDTITDSFAVGGHFVARNSLHLAISSFATTSSLEELTNEEVKTRLLDIALSFDGGDEQYPEWHELYEAVQQVGRQGDGPVWAKFQRERTGLLARIMASAKAAGCDTETWNQRSHV